MLKEFTAVIEKRDKWYIGYIEELPGVNTQGRTLKEVKENLHEALRMIIETNKELSALKQGSTLVIKEPISIEI
jgi:predicted RNase H-like HicB family nuclease